MTTHSSPKSPSKRCGVCGGELYQFSAPDTVRVPPKRLPVVCVRCGEISIMGQAVRLPGAMEAQAADMAERASKAAREAKERLEQDPETRVQKYFENVYCEGFMQGFFRALAFYQHHHKDGRLIRMRELWETQAKHRLGTGDPDYYLTTFPEDAREEFEKLLYLGAKRRQRAQGTENEHSPVQKSAPHV